MDGWVDGRLRRWKNIDGAIDRLEMLIGTSFACPICRAERIVIALKNGGENLRCPLGHTFECTAQLE